MNEQTIEQQTEGVSFDASFTCEVTDEVLEAAGGPMVRAFTFLTMSCDYACKHY